jgi:hypothetical protein
MGWPDEKHWLQHAIGCGWLQQATYTSVLNQLLLQNLEEIDFFSFGVHDEIADETQLLFRTRSVIVCNQTLDWLASSCYRWVVLYWYIFTIKWKNIKMLAYLQWGR